MVWAWNFRDSEELAATSEVIEFYEREIERDREREGEVRWEREQSLPKSCSNFWQLSCKVSACR